MARRSAYPGDSELVEPPRRCIIVHTTRQSTATLSRLDPVPPATGPGLLDRLSLEEWSRPGRLGAPAPAVARRAVIDVDVVVVSHNGRDQVLACLDSLAAAADGAVLSVTVVDNGSDDGLPEAVAARQDGTRVITMGLDTGLATGANAGMARGCGRYVLVLDPKTVVAPGSLRTLVEFADRHPSAGVVAPRLFRGNGRTAPGQPKQPAYEVAWVPGTAMLVPRVVHAATAGFDEDFFSFWADIEWCRRIRAAGYSVWCLPTASVRHDEGAGGDAQGDLATVRDYHDGAYRYWLKHDAPAAWHPGYWASAATLKTRALSAELRGRFDQLPDTTPRPRRPRPRRTQPQLERPSWD